MGKINKKALIISLLLTVVCALLLFGYMRTLKTPAAETPKTSIPVSVRDIGVGEAIKPEDIRMLEVGTDSVPEGILTDRTELEGKYAGAAILVGEPFRELRLTTKEELPLSHNLPAGLRAVSIFINEANLLSMQIVPGDRIDLIASWSLKTKEGDEVQLTNTVLQDIGVLAIGPNRVLEDNAVKPATASNNVEDMPKTITLAVTPEQAEQVIFNTQYSSFTLALRGYGDDEVIKTEGVVITDMIPQRLLPFAVMPGEASKSGSSSGGSAADGSSDGGSGAAAAIP